jgi:steroid delta-isomerase-like uncharacterized protein
MTPTNETLARRWFEEVWNQQRSDTIRELLTAETRCHTEAGMHQGHDRFLEHVHSPFLAMFPDVKMTIEDTVSEGDRVVVRWRFQGTHTGKGLGMEPTGRKVSFRGMTWLRFESGKIVEGVDCWNLSGLMETLRTGNAAPSFELA